MKVTVMGFRPYDMNDDAGNRLYGISLYVAQKNPDDNEMRGYQVSKYNISGGGETYRKLMDHQFIKPFEADLDIFVSPAGKAKVIGMMIGVEK